MDLQNKAIFWDRDGIINEIEVDNGKSLSPRKLGYLNIIFTNQPDISRLLMAKKDLDLMNQFLLNNYPIEKIYFCPHSNEDNCDCRKPLPGMVNQGIKEFSLDPSKCFVIGDRITDIISGNLAGIKNLFLLKKCYSLNCYSGNCIPDYKNISDIREIPSILRGQL